MDMKMNLNEIKYDEAQIVKKLSIKEDSAVLCMERAGVRFVLRAYRREIPAYRALAGHSCPYLPEIYRVEQQGDYFIVEEEYIDGICLQDILDAGAHMDQQRAAAMASAVCGALSALHRAGFIHRDVKPEHVMTVSQKRIALIDLDASMRIIPEKTSDTRLLGTATYAAPEQFGLTRSDVRTDIYAVGILINELLTGAHPAVTRWREGALAPVIDRCIQMNPQDRYQSAEELLRALPSENAKGTEEKKTPKKMIALIAAGVLGVGILCSGALGGIFSPDASDKIYTPGVSDSQGVDGASDSQGVDGMTDAPEGWDDEWLQMNLGRPDDTIYYNFRQGSKGAKLYTEDGTEIDETYNVYADPAVGTVTGWDMRRDGESAWNFTSEGCEMGATGYLHAEKDGKAYAMQVLVMGEPISAYTSVPSMQDLAAGYLKPEIDMYYPDQRVIRCTYNPKKKTTIYLAAMYGFDHLMPTCSDPHVTIARCSDSSGWISALYEMTFENPDGGEVSFEVPNEDTSLTFVFREK